MAKFTEFVIMCKVAVMDSLIKYDAIVSAILAISNRSCLLAAYHVHGTGLRVYVILFNYHNNHMGLKKTLIFPILQVMMKTPNIY